MAGRTIQISYNLCPPSDVTQPIAGPSSQPIPTSTTITYPIPPPQRTTPQPLTMTTPESDTAKYYTDLTASVRELQIALNENLTYWKDAVGDREKSKEDMGKVAYGKGRATVMSLAVNGEFRDGQDQKQNGEQGKSQKAEVEESSDEESEDE